MLRIALPAVAFGLGCLISAVEAAPITGLFNTGLDSSGVVLPNGGNDAHYTIVETGLAAVAYTNPAYAADNAASRWISSDANGGDGPSSTTFTYRLTFSLAGLDAGSAVISGLWGVDNIGEILLNGVDTGVALAWGTDAFNRLHAFDITTGFLAGINTLDFVVHNQWLNPNDPNPGPGGLRVDVLTGAAEAIAAVPEPATLALLGAGLLALYVLRRRRAPAPI